MNTRRRNSSTGKPDPGRRSSRSQACSTGEQIQPEPQKKSRQSRTSKVTSSSKPKTSKEERKQKDLCSNLQNITSSFFELPGYEKQSGMLRSLLKTTVKHMESNSVLVCGPRGCGKSTLVEKCLQAECDPDKTEIMFFNGFMSTDASRLFLQMQNQSDIDERSISTLMESLREKCCSTDLTLVIVLDEFDRFCKVADQTFLYNVFDLSQKCRNLFVIGMTCRLDCLELLEKRVKSRMNQTVINLYSPFASLDQVLDFVSSVTEDKKLSSETKALISTQFCKHMTMRALKRTLIGVEASSDSTSHFNKNPVVECITSLSNMEFLVLVEADNFCRNNAVRCLPCDVILKAVEKLPGRNRIPRPLAYKLIGNIVSYGLLKKNSTRDVNLLNDWTMLHLNFNSEDLRDALKEMHTILPANLQQIINFR